VRLPVSVCFHTAAIAWPRETVAVFSWSFRLKSRYEITLLSCPPFVTALYAVWVIRMTTLFCYNGLAYKVVRLA